MPRAPLPAPPGAGAPPFGGFAGQALAMRCVDEIEKIGDAREAEKAAKAAAAQEAAEEAARAAEALEEAAEQAKAMSQRNGSADVPHTCALSGVRGSVMVCLLRRTAGGKCGPCFTRAGPVHVPQVRKGL